MYLHLGQSIVVPHKNILGIFDLDNSSWAYKTREFLERAEQEGRVVNVSAELPKSFIVTVRQPPTVYISQISAATLKKRSGQIDDIRNAGR